MGFLKYTLQDMLNVRDEALQKTQEYGTAVQDLSKAIEEMKAYWESSETGSNEEFTAIFKRSEPDLEKAKEMMLEFCNRMEEKAREFQKAEQKSMDNFIN